MIRKVTITPIFNAKHIMDATLKKDWFRFQNEAFKMGKSLHVYMQSYINSNRKRKGGTGNLAKSINFHSTSLPGFISWGIGNIAVLNSKAKYWYVINYGKTVTGKPFIPGGGNFVPGSFEGNKPSSAMKGGVQKFNYNDGTGYGMYPKQAIRPMNYIQATRHQLDRRMRLLLASIKGGK